MCGIVGSASVTSQSNRSWLSASRDTLIHRGPDDFGEWWSDDNRVGFAHRRLSILELSPLGHQPMHLPNRGLTIVFNGEIYNFIELRKELSERGHGFRSNSDTEVLLAAYAEWGTDCPRHLDGMFAFALYDAIEERLFLARDRAGEKPLFFRQHGDALFFASELKAFLSQPFMPRRIDPEALDYFLALGYVPGDQCILAGYHKLPPAHALSFDLRQGVTTVWRYWDLPEFDPAASADEPALVDELESLLRNAVAKQLRADVPVGILLSGGVDSSLIAAVAASIVPRLRTFTVGFPGHSREDESAHARQVAQHFDTEHTELLAESPSAQLISRLALQFDEPIADSSMIPTYQVSQLVRDQCTVALGGDGGDEMFGGYHHYSRLLKMQEYGKFAPRLGLKSLALGADRLLPVGFKGRSYIQALGVDLTRDMPMMSSVFFDAATRRRLMKSHGHWETPADRTVQANIPFNPDLIQLATRTDFSLFLPDDVLVKVDRASMLASLEVRAPLLDYHLIEFSFNRVPAHLKVSASQKKILLKRLTHGLLPDGFDRDRKQGFTIPMASWLKEAPFIDLFQDALSGNDCIFDRGVVQSLFRGENRFRTNGHRLFALVMFELWRKAYGTYL